MGVFLFDAEVTVPPVKFVWQESCAICCLFSAHALFYVVWQKQRITLSPEDPRSILKFDWQMPINMLGSPDDKFVLQLPNNIRMETTGDSIRITP